MNQSQTALLSQSVAFLRRILPGPKKDLWKMIAIFLFGALVADILFWNNTTLKNMVILNYSVDAYLYLLYGVLIAGLLWYLYFHVAVMQYLKFLKAGEKASILKIYSEAGRSFGPYLGASVLSLGMSCLWGLLLIIPGIWRGLEYSLAGLACVVDGKKGGEALAHSRRLAKRRANDFFLTMTILFFTVFVLYATLVLTIGTLKTFVPDHMILVLDAIKYIQYTGLLFLSIAWIAMVYSVYEELSKA